MDYPISEDMDCKTKEEASILLDSLASSVSLTQDKDAMIKLTSTLYIRSRDVRAMKMEEYPVWDERPLGTPFDGQTTLDSYVFYPSENDTITITEVKE